MIQNSGFSGFKVTPQQFAAMRPELQTEAVARLIDVGISAEAIGRHWQIADAARIATKRHFVRPVGMDAVDKDWVPEAELALERERDLQRQEEAQRQRAGDLDRFEALTRKGWTRTQSATKHQHILEHGVRKRKGKVCNDADLCAVVRVSSADVCRYLQRLAGLGLIEREPDQGPDPRPVLYRVTVLGFELVAVAARLRAGDNA